jgi:hypothetical protein
MLGHPEDADWVTCSAEEWDMGTGITQANYVYLTSYNTPTTNSNYWDNFNITNLSTIDRWTNDSFVSMTEASNWSNVSKIATSTVGSVIAWQVWANDTSNNINQSVVYSYTTTESGVTPDECITPTTPVWWINKNCTVTNQTISTTARMYLNGSYTYLMTNTTLCVGNFTGLPGAKLVFGVNNWPVFGGCG